MDARDVLLMVAVVGAVLVMGHLRSRRRRFDRVASRPSDRSTHEDDAEARALVAEVERKRVARAKETRETKKRRKKKPEASTPETAASFADGIEASTLLGAIVVGPTTNASVHLGRRVGAGFAVSVVVEASERCVVQPLRDGEYLVLGMKQPGVAIYVGPAASAADHAWAARYDAWQAQDLENVLSSLQGEAGVEHDPPPPHTLSGVVMRASHAISAGYPSSAPVPPAQVEDGGEAPPPETWILMVGLDDGAEYAPDA